MSDQITVSWVKCALDTEPRECSAAKAIAAIRTGGKKLRGQVESLRSTIQRELTDHGDAKRAKQAASEQKKQLPAILWSGTFTKRANDAMVQHSGLLCADLDGLNGFLSSARQKLKGSSHLWALFTSPSGDGLKAVFRVPAHASKHAGSFHAVEQHVRELTGKEVDRACKDVARLCFLSYDPELYYNAYAREIELLCEPERPARVFNGVVDLNARQRIAVQLLGSIDWRSETEGFCACPGKDRHTAGNGAKDCKVYLDGPPSLHCVHNSCRAIVDAVKHSLRSQVGKAEYIPEVNPAPIGSAQSVNTDDQAIVSLAALPPLEYERQREQKAKDMNCRAAVLDKLVEAKRGKGSDSLQGSDVICPDVELWANPVDGAAVLNEVAETFARYLALPDGAADASALWAVHAHAYKAFTHSPRLNFRSPEKGCGKTTALDVLGVLTPKALRTESLTPAVLFRLVEGHEPTLLLDETDSYLKEANDLRGLLNAGHKRGAMALRCEGENNTVRGFKAFAPAALAGIGELPGTLHDRSIVIMLVRAKPGEVRERFDSRRTEKETELCRKCARWAADNFEALKACDPQLPETAFNRLADNWRPMFAIAQKIGGDWPKRASEAFAKLTSSNDLDAQGVGTTLLADIATIFGKEHADKLPSAKLADLLAAIEGRPWAEWGRQQKPISPNQLAKLLRRFGVSPQVIRIGDETPRGYLLEQFQEPFDRYLPIPLLTDRNSATLLGKTPVSEVQHPHSVLHPGNGSFTRECCGVAPCAEGREVNRDQNGKRSVPNLKTLFPVSHRDRPSVTECGMTDAVVGIVIKSG